MPLLHISIALLAGVLLGSIYAFPLWSLAAPLPFFLAAVFIRSHRKTLILTALCLLAVVGGALRFQSSILPLDSTRVQFYNEKGTACIEGMVTNAPEIKGASTEFRFSSSKIRVHDNSTEITGNVLVRLPFYRDLHYGDVLQLTGKLETPPQLEDFDYRNYLANQGIYSLMNYPGASVLETGRGFPPLAWIYNVRSTLAESLSTCLPEPQSSLARAILLGLRGSLPASLVQSFYATGTTHLIAISGMNLTIVLGMILTSAIWIFGRKNRIYIWVSLALIWLYTVLTGMPATMVRATIMGSVFLLAELLGRQRSGLAALALAGALMAGIEPRLLWDASFQLSFLSMLGLVLITPHLIAFSGAHVSASSRFISVLRNVVVISFGATLAALIATWPVTAMDFHSFSLVSIPATFFAMPSFPGIIITSMLTSVGGLIWQPLGMILGWIAWLFLSYFLLVVQVFSDIPFAYIQNISLQPWQAVIYYLALAGLLLCLRYRQPVWSFFKAFFINLHSRIIALQVITLSPFVYWLLAILLLANILVWTAYAMLPDGRLHVSILDVGQGESILIRTPDGQNLLVDAGPDPASACTQLGKTLPFWDRKIAMLILTQLQSDHISGSLGLLQKYNIGAMAVSPLVSDSVLSGELINAGKNKSVELYKFSEGQQLNLGPGIRLNVLNPPPGLLTGTADDVNNNSIVLRLSYNNVSFLLTGDIGMDAERYLAANRADLRSDVLKVAHHGSKGSSCDEFLAIVSPSAAVISAGAVNRFGHPNKEVMDRLAGRLENSRIFVTAVHGSVEFITDGQKLWYKTEKIDAGLP